MNLGDSMSWGCSPGWFLLLLVFLQKGHFSSASEKNSQPLILYVARLSFINVQEIKTFSHEEKLKELVPHRLTLKERPKIFKIFPKYSNRKDMKKEWLPEHQEERTMEREKNRHKEKLYHLCITGVKSNGTAPLKKILAVSYKTKHETVL